MFLARTDEQRRFEAALAELRDHTGGAGPSQVFVVHGLGGMGKSELCRRFEAIAHGELPATGHNAGRYVVVMVNWEDERENHAPAPSDPAGMQTRDMFAALYDAVANDEDVSSSRRLRRRTSRAFAPYLDVVAQMPDLQLQVGDGDETWGAAVESGLRAAGKAGQVATGAPIAPAADGAARIARAARQKRSSRTRADQINSALRPEESLTREFARGLRELSSLRPVVAILDTYEIVASCGAWIRQAMLGSGGRVLWVVAARMEAEDEAGTGGELASFRRELPEEKLRVIPMSLFERQTISEALAQRGIAGADDGPTLDAAASLTRGVPLAVGIVAGMLAQGESVEEIGLSVTIKGDTPALVRELTERYLLHALRDPALKEDIPLLYGLALLYTDQSDPGILRALWGSDEDVADTQRRLAERHDFVLTGSRRLHQEVRDTFRLYLLDSTRRDKMREANQRAAKVALERVRQCDAPGSVEERIAREDWRAAVATLIWHRFWESNEAGLTALGEVLPAAMLLQRGFANELLGLATFFWETFGPEQKTLHHGLTSLLPLGAFLDGWLSRRRDIMLRGTEPAEPDGRKTAEDRQLALRWLQKRSREEAELPTEPSAEAVAELLLARSNARVDPEAALLELEAATAALPANGGSLAVLVSQTAREICEVLFKLPQGERPSSELVRAALLRVRYEPDVVAAWFSLGWAFRVADENDEAIGAFDELIERFADRNDVDVRRIVSRAFLSKANLPGKLAQGDRELETYDELIKRFGEDEDHLVRRDVAAAMFGKGFALAQEGSRQEALEAYAEIARRFAGEADPELRRTVGAATYNRADLLRSSDPEKAMAVFDETIALEPGAGETKLRAIVAKARMNKAFLIRRKGGAKAAEIFEQLIEQHTSDDGEENRLLVARARLQHATVLHVAGDSIDCARVEEEVDAVLEALESPPGMFFGEYALFFADVADDQERAQEMFERALDEAPEHTNTIGNFARLLFEQGEWEQAISAADRALSLAKDSEVELILEVNFYLAALGPMERFGESLSEVRRLIEDGVRSSEWTLDRVLARASAERREDIEWLRVLAEVINEVRSPEVLNGWQAWREARLRPQ